MLRKTIACFTLGLILACSTILCKSAETTDAIKQKAAQALRQGDEALEKGNYKDALLPCEAAFKLFEQINAKEGIAAGASRLGRVYSGLGQYEKAVAFLEKALALRVELGDKPGRGWDLTRLAAVELNRGRYRKALSLSEQAIEIHTEAGDRKGLAEALRNLGGAHRNMGHHKEAQEYSERSLAVAQALGDKREVATTLNSLGIVHQEIGAYAQALEYYKKSAALAEEIGDKRGMAALRNNIGLLHRELGDYAEAMANHQQSLQIKREIGDKRGVGSSLHNIGEVDMSLGRYAEALEHYQKARQIFEEIGARRELAQSLSTLGIVHRNLGNPAQALDYYQKSLQIREAIGDKNGVAQSLHGIANMHAHLGHPAEALAYHEKSLKVKEEIGNKRLVAISLLDIGHLHAGAGRYDEALSHYQKSWRILEAIGDKSGTGQSLSSMGYMYYKKGDLREADRRLSEAVARARQVGRRDVLFSSLYRRGLVLRDGGRADEAVRSMEEAIGVIEQVRRQIPLAEQRAGFLQEKLEVYESLIGLLAELNHTEELFHYVERAKARAFLDLLTEARAEARKQVSPELLEKEKQTLARLLQRQRRFQAAASQPQPDPAQMAERQEQLKSAEQEYENLRLEIRRVNPEYAAINYPEPIRLEQTQRLLDDHEALLEYALGPERSFLLAVTRADFRVYPLPKREELERKAADFVKLLDQLPMESSTLAYVRASYDLYEALVKPAQAQLDGKRSITVVPDGGLALLPFPALLTQKIQRADAVPLKDFPYLVKAYDISYIQSASILERVKAEPRRGPWTQTFVGFAPIHFAEHTALAERGVETADTTRAAIGDLYRSGVTLGNLPYTRKELEWIRDFYGDKEARLYLEHEATEERVKESGLRNYRYVHFATHGIIHPDKPEFSSIILRTEGREDGYLQVAEILNLELNADLVVISSCQSGKGKPMRGEGLIGLTRGFMYAGSASVLASLWSVQDKPTAYLMRAFYKNLRTATKSEALRRAQLEFIKGDDETLAYYSHPYYWSPFVLIGAR